MTALKSLTLATLPKHGNNPLLNRRSNTIARLEEQKLLLADPSYIRTTQRWTKKDGTRVIVDRQRLDSTISDSAVKAASLLSGQVLAKLALQTKAFETETSSAIKKLKPAYDNLGKYVAEHQKAYRAVVSKIGAQRTVANQVAELQKTCAIEKDKIAQLSKQINALGDLNKHIRDARSVLKKSIEKQTNSLTEFASRIEELSDGTISVTIEEEGDLSEIYAALETIAVRTRSQDAVRIRRFAEQIASEGVWKTLDKLTTEVGALLSWKLGADANEKKKRPTRYFDNCIDSWRERRC